MSMIQIQELSYNITTCYTYPVTIEVNPSQAHMDIIKTLSEDNPQLVDALPVNLLGLH